ncbi:DUF3099 domain-containing protein [Streptomyces laurentii]|uniref:DUF3099 domain-containing protein n=1 Tax=Streptomyces laurentii TaxID=39478 RepID=UPI0033D628DF
MRKHGGSEVFRITGARQGLTEDVRGRQRRYVVSMLIRTVAVIAATTLWNVERPVAIVALVLGALLPYVAVVIANAGRETTPSLPSTFGVTPIRPALDPASEAGTEDRTKARTEAPTEARTEGRPDDGAEAGAEDGAEDAHRRDDHAA